MLGYTKKDLASFVRMYDKIEDRIEKIVPRLTSYYPSSSYVVGFSIRSDSCVVTTKYYDASDCFDPYNHYEFDVKYLAMSDEEIDAEVMRRKEKRRRLQEEHERKEYERLRAKYGEKEVKE